MTTAIEHVPAPPNRAATEATWRKWMVSYGRHSRRVREFLGLSQEELARLAGVSQGAVSRFESGRGLNTPFLIILRLNLAVARQLRQLDPAVLSEDAHRFLRHMDLVRQPDTGEPPAPGGVAFDDLRILGSAGEERLLHAYRAVPESRRPAFLSIVEAAAKAVGS